MSLSSSPLGDPEADQPPRPLDDRDQRQLVGQHTDAASPPDELDIVRVANDYDRT